MRHHLTDKQAQMHHGFQQHAHVQTQTGAAQGVVSHTHHAVSAGSCLTRALRKQEANEEEHQTVNIHEW